MQVITEFAMSLIVFSLVATMLEILIPSSNFKKYVQFVIGLVLVVIIFTPMAKLLRSDFEQEVAEGIESVTSNATHVTEMAKMQKGEILAGNKEYILNEFSNALKENANEEMVRRFSYSIDAIDIILKDDECEVNYENISEINVRIASNENTKNVLSIEEVRIGEKNQNIGKQTTRDLLEVQRFLIKAWELDATNIKINITL